MAPIGVLAVIFAAAMLLELGTAASVRRPRSR